MPTTTPRVGLSAADVLTTTRALLGPAWTAYTAGDGRTGSLRTHHGHIITFDGFAGRTLYATALLPSGRRFPFASMAKAATTAAFAATLAEMIRDTFVPLHNAQSPVRHTAAVVLDALGARGREVTWRHGAAHIHWGLPSGGRARADIRQPATGRYVQVRATATFSDPSPEEAAALLRVIDTANADLRQKDPVRGSLARLLKAAAPGLRPISAHDESASGGPLTSVLAVDDVVTVELGYPGTESDAWVARISVHGPLHDVLAAVRAV
ncbi:hypothetical protein AB0G49_14175 [Streptomyces longwoodensis]|uniref:hypothetical protein n=1 Tax=Streptomyces longwoodensis TaxID=68231 RepID=UPI0033E484EE